MYLKTGKYFLKIAPLIHRNMSLWRKAVLSYVNTTFKSNYNHDIWRKRGYWMVKLQHKLLWISPFTLMHKVKLAIPLKSAHQEYTPKSFWYKAEASPSSAWFTWLPLHHGDLEEGYLAVRQKKEISTGYQDLAICEAVGARRGRRSPGNKKRGGRGEEVESYREWDGDTACSLWIQKTKTKS